MRNIKKMTLLAILLISTLILAGCTTFDNFKAEFFGNGQKAETVVIGVFEPQTGVNSQQGEEEIQGIQLANEQYPEVLGRKVELVYEDTQSNIYATESAIQELINYKPALILGCYGEATALAAAKYVDKEMIPTIGISNTNTLTTLNYHYYASVAYNNTVQGKALGKYVSKQFAGKNIAIFRQADDDSTTEMTNRFVKYATAEQKHPVKVGAKEYYQVDSTDFTENLQNILKCNADAVFCPIGIEAADQLFTQVENLKMTYITFIGTNQWYSDDFLAMKQKHPKIKVLLTSGFVSDEADDKAETDQFVQAYQNKFGKDKMPTENVALAYDAYVLAIQSIEKAKTTEGPKIMEAILSTSGFPGITGDITLDENGRATKPIQLCTIEKRQFVSLGEIK